MAEPATIIRFTKELIVAQHLCGRVLCFNGRKMLCNHIHSVSENPGGGYLVKIGLIDAPPPLSCIIHTRLGCTLVEFDPHDPTDLDSLPFLTNPN